VVDYDDARIVLTTSQAEVFGFEYAKARLPTGLQARVVGSIYAPEVTGKTRPQWGLSYVACHNVGKWLAIDDGAYGWQDANRDHLLLRNEFAGLGGAGGGKSWRVTCKRRTQADCCLINCY
jgi:hypothetical protein